MPPGPEHVDQAQHNLNFLETFFRDHKFNDWSITVAFYTSVHIVENAIFNVQDISFQGDQLKILHSDDLEKALQKANIKFSSLSPHVARNLIVEENFLQIANHHKSLYRQSRNSRYKKYQITDIETDIIVKPALREIIEWSNSNYKTKFRVNLN